MKACARPADLNSLCDNEARWASQCFAFKFFSAGSPKPLICLLLAIHLPFARRKKELP
jgi:hypothetical protein